MLAIGIDPPRGVLLYGPPGTGKTMLVKAVANSTTASFIRVNGSEFVQKYLGEGPRMVRDVFRMARENSPAIIFIDEIDAIATKRFDAQTGADREVQRILLELLNQMDGFEQSSNVKVIMATNRADTLDPALLRPGRLDRKIEFPSLRDRRERRLIFSTIASKMSLSPEVDLDSLIVRNEPLSGAVIAAIMQEAGLRAVRKNRYNIIQSDLEDAYAAQVKTGQEADRYGTFSNLPAIGTWLTKHIDSNSTGKSSMGRASGWISDYARRTGGPLAVLSTSRLFHIRTTTDALGIPLG
jgi:26S proteasome regulatory subunit T3